MGFLCATSTRAFFPFSCRCNATDKVSVCLTGPQVLDPTTPVCTFRIGEDGQGCTLPDGRKQPPWLCTTGRCFFRDPPEEAWFTIALAIISSIIIVPIVLIQKWVFENWLMPPTEVLPGVGSGGFDPLAMLLGFVGLGKKKNLAVLEAREVKEMDQEQIENEVEHETEERTANLKMQREELVQKIMAANFKLMKYKRDVKNKERRKSASRLEELSQDLTEWQQQLRAFDVKWGFGKDGRLRKGGLIDAVRKTTARDKLKLVVARELAETRALLEAIAPVNVDGFTRDWDGLTEDAMAELDRHTLLWEQHRLDRLSPPARAVYVMNALEFDETAVFPVKAWKKVLGWIIVIGCLLICTAQVMVWSLSVLKGVANAWLFSFLVSLFQDLCVFIPTRLLIFNVLMPLLVKDEIRTKHDDLSSADGITYSVRFASGAAERVAVLDFMDSEVSKDPNGQRAPREPLRVSKLIVEANHLQSLIPGHEAEAESATARRKRLKKEKAQRQNRLIKKDNAGLKAKLINFTVTFGVLFVMLPPDIRNSIVEQIMPATWGAFVLTLTALYSIHWSAAAAPLVAFVVLYFVYSFRAAQKARLAKMATKAPPGPLAALLFKMMRRRQREFTAETSDVAITGAGFEDGSHFGPSDAFAPPGAISTNPLLTSKRK